MADPIIEAMKKATPDGSIPQLPAGRAGTPTDMSGVVLFLASKAGAFLTGTVLLTDGGAVSIEPSSY